MTSQEIRRHAAVARAVEDSRKYAECGLRYVLELRLCAPKFVGIAHVGKMDAAIANISWRAGGAKNDPTDSVSQLYNELFSGSHVGGSGEDIDLLNRLTALEESMLSAVMEDTKRLQNQLGVSDKQRLEQHLDGLRSLEQRLQLLEGSTNCDGITLPDYGSVMREKAAAMSKLVAAALACDITRVFTFEWSTNQSEFVYSELRIGVTHHNNVTHKLGSRQGKTISARSSSW